MAKKSITKIMSEGGKLPANLAAEVIESILKKKGCFKPGTTDEYEMYGFPKHAPCDWYVLKRSSGKSSRIMRMGDSVKAKELTELMLNEIEPEKLFIILLRSCGITDFLGTLIDENKYDHGLVKMLHNIILNKRYESSLESLVDNPALKEYIGKSLANAENEYEQKINERKRELQRLNEEVLKAEKKLELFKRSELRAVNIDLREFMEVEQNVS